MKVKLLTDNKGPKGSIHEVYIKLHDFDGGIWYIIPSVKGYHRDGSTIERDDIYDYQHPDATVENGFMRGEIVPPGYTFAIRRECEEIKDIKNNREAISLLDKEW